MNRKLGLAATTLSVALLLGACGGDGQYDKLVKKADKAMAELNIEKAIEAYEELLTLDPAKIEYGASRLLMIQEKLDSAYDLQEEMTYLESIANEAKAQVEALEYKAEFTYDITEVQYTLNNALETLSNFPTTQMYKDVKALSDVVTENTKSKLIEPLIEEIESDMDALKYDVALEKVHQLSELQNAFGSLIALEDVQDYLNTIEAEMARYAVQPRTYKKRDIVLFEDANAGKMTFLGEGIEDDSLHAFFKVEGGLQNLVTNDQLSMDTRFIFESGDYDAASSYSVTVYEDYAILSLDISDAENENIVRFDYNLNILGLEEMKTVALTATDGEETIPAVLYLAQEKTLDVDYKVETDDYTLKVTNLVVDGNYLKAQGKLNAKKDLDSSTRINGYLSVPEKMIFNSERLDSDEYFAGIEKDVEFTFDFDHYGILSDEVSYALLAIAEQNFVIDLKTGKEVGEKQFQLENLPSFRSEDSDFKYSEKILSEGLLIADKAGKKYAQYFGLQTRESWGDIYSPNVYYNFDQQFTKVKMDVGVTGITADPAYGSSVVSFVADDNVLKTMTLTSDSVSETIELNVANVAKFEIRVEQTKGNDGYQEIIIGNSVLTSK